MVKAIIFDVFGVLCSDPSVNWFTTKVPNHEALTNDFHAICNKSDYGKVTKQEFYEELSELTGIPTEEVLSGINAELKVNQAVIDLTMSLRGHYKLALMSNANDEWIVPILKENNMDDIFDTVVVSANIGMVKPDRGIFDYTLNKLGVSPSEAIFIDDRPTNVDAGNSFGVKSILFQNYDLLIDQLESNGVEIPPVSI